jgi:3-hydroxybutyryl-CoA dehydrogenase
MTMEPIAVIGGGLMGAGIAQVFAVAGHPVAVYEPLATVRETVMARIGQGIGQIGDDVRAIANVRVCDNLAEAVRQAGFVTEAAPEKIDIKRAIFAKLATHAPRSAILASNSSVMPVGSIAEGLATADRIVGTHWWNPATLIPLVEVIQGAETSDATVAKTMKLLTTIGKVPAHVKKDVPGFVANRLQHALWREALAMVEAGICDARTVDDCVKNSFGLRLAVLGPLENADLIGLELTRDIHRTIIPELNRDASPNPILDRCIAAGKLGFSSGEGLQSWSPVEQTELRQRLVEHLIAARRAK